MQTRAERLEIKNVAPGLPLDMNAFRREVEVLRRAVACVVLTVQHNPIRINPRTDEPELEEYLNVERLLAAAGVINARIEWDATQRIWRIG